MPDPILNYVVCDKISGVPVSVYSDTDRLNEDFPGTILDGVLVRFHHKNDEGSVIILPVVNKDLTDDERKRRHDVLPNPFDKIVVQGKQDDMLDVYRQILAAHLKEYNEDNYYTVVYFMFEQMLTVLTEKDKLDLDMVQCGLQDELDTIIKLQRVKRMVGEQPPSRMYDKSFDM